MSKKIFIEGMSCGHCVNHVEEALMEIDGVNKVEVSLDEKVAKVELDYEIDDKKFYEAIDEVGYEVINIED